METQKQLFVKITLDTWNARVDAANKLIDSLSDEDLMKEVSPGRNCGIYLIGHLALVNDKMLPLLDFEKQQYAAFDDAFLNKPDKSMELPSAKEVRAMWKNSNAILSAHFAKLTPDQWFERHTSVSAEDFIKEPNRNKINVVLGRTNHMQYHVGQIALLKK